MRRLFESVPNFSEGRSHEVTVEIAGAASAAGAAVLDSSLDPDHDRLVLTLAAGRAVEPVFAAIASAVRLIDLGSHSGVHPRRGAADVVPLVPLGSASLEECVAIAHSLGERVWAELRVPVHYYGAAGSTTLAEIRSASPPRPDLGRGPHPTAGVVSIGARRPLVAYNLLLNGVGLPEARALARSLRESSGGVRGVQALVFEVAAGVQLSMNLTRLEECPPARALAEALGRLPAGGSVVREEVVGLCPASAAAGCAGADGRLLEGRLAAAGARLGAAICAARGTGSEESRLVGLRLEAEAAALASLRFEEALAGAERAAALRRVLRAGSIAAPEADLLLAVAADALRAALPAAVTRTHPERVAALDRWLAQQP